MEKKVSSVEYIVSYDEIAEKLNINANIRYLWTDKDNRQLKIICEEKSFDKS